LERLGVIEGREEDLRGKKERNTMIGFSK